MEISEQTRWIAGILLLAVVTIEAGGLYMLRLVRGKAPATPFEVTFARAGHAHAGVLVILSLVVQLYADAATPGGVVGFVARNGVPFAAIFMPAGFFLSSMGAGRTAPNRLILLLYAGAISLAFGVVALGLSLLLRL